MKICFLGDAQSVHLHKWVNWFLSKKWEVSVITFRQAEISGATVYFVGNHINENDNGKIAYLKQLLKIPKIKKLLKTINPDIVNAHYLTNYGFIAALTKISALAQTTWGTDILVTPYKNSLYKWITRVSLKKADLITSDSMHMSQMIEALLENERRPIITLPMGVDTTVFNRKIPFKNNNSPIVLSLRNLINNSNIDVIIYAFKSFVKIYPQAQLIIANDGVLRNSLELLVTKENLNRNVKFLGFIDRKTIADLLTTCDYYISIPTSDATSVTLLEAMSSGMYPIVSDIPANKEWIRTKVQGKVVTINAEMIAQALLESEHTDTIKEQAAELNREIILKEASLHETMKIIEEYYYRIISQNK